MKAVSSNSELDAFRAAAVLATKKHNVALAEVREERQDEVKV